jgi:alkanesulfonate monooxygenase SsuD/methylene tetrahydromethanopterin reductase-like flavin-dependent oxidoreductase (luciferase family)
MPPERRAQAVVATPPQAVDWLARFYDAGFHGFILRNQSVPTVEALALAGEVIRLMAGSPASA